MVWVTVTSPSVKRLTVTQQTHYDVTSVATVANGHCAVIHNVDWRYPLPGVTNVTLWLVNLCV